MPRKICFMPLVSSIVMGFGVGLATHQIWAFLIIGLGFGAFVLSVTQKDALLKL